MPTELLALIDKPFLFAFVLFVGALLGIAVERVFQRLESANRKAYWKGRRSAKKTSNNIRPEKSKSETTRIDTATDQLRTVIAASFASRALLNKPERRLLSVLDQALETESPGWRAHGQVSLGEILSSDDQEAFRAINSKRVDILIVDKDTQPLHAVEFQGTGHHLGKETAGRDAVKREALRRAGISYVEVISGDTPAEVRAMVQKLVRKSQIVSS